jgi:hypothetical protein
MITGQTQTAKVDTNHLANDGLQDLAGQNPEAYGLVGGIEILEIVGL